MLGADTAAARTTSLPSVKAIPLWLVLLLPMPALIPLANAYVVPLLKGQLPTGFVQYDMPSYIAHARGYFNGGFHLTYGNPYAGYDTPAIYFQPHIFLMGCLVHLGLDPGVAFNLFGMAALVFTTWVAILFYQEVVGLETPAKLLGLVCFFWGGGLLVIAGFAAGIIHGQLNWTNVWQFDVANGWWMLNFGRNLVYPTEAYYHGVFLLALLCLLRGRTAATLALAALLSASHPFTGLNLLLILVAYSALELTLGSKAVQPALLAGAAVITIAHLGYYLIFLNRFSDHRTLQSQWQLAWLYRPSTYVPSLLFVGMLAVFHLARQPILRDSRNRLFLVWFAVIFALTQHNLLIKPTQPIHFAHGYDWMALFFLAAPLLIAIFDRLLAIPSPGWRSTFVAAAMLLFLCDNIVWFGCFFLKTPVAQQRVALSRDQKDVLQWLARNAKPRAMVVSEDPVISHLVSTYTSVRSWEGHTDNTPSVRQRKAEVEEAFQKGRIIPEWEQMPVFYVSARSENWHPAPNIVELYHNQVFSISGRSEFSKVTTEPRP